MASNSLPDALAPLFALAEDMADGCHNHEVAVGLKQNLEINLRPAIAAARTAETNFAAAKGAKETFATNLRVADSNARSFIKAASAILGQSLGNTWSALWEPTGFPDQSTAVPSTQEGRMNLCKALNAYLLANPTAEVNTPKLVFTAAKADALFAALSDARTAVNDGNTAAGAKKLVRDAAVEALKNRMRGLIAELGQLLGDTDPLWDAFGLNAPGADSTPEVPEGLVVTPGVAGSLHVDWADARRALRYRVWKQLEGPDPKPVAVATVNDSDATLTGLPSGKPLKISVTALNDAGESPACAAVTVTVP